MAMLAVAAASADAAAAAAEFYWARLQWGDRGTSVAPTAARLFKQFGQADS